jgi:ketosteroid isomerase-like protein
MPRADEVSDGAASFGPVGTWYTRSMMSAAFEAALGRTAAGLAAMGAGDARPYQACWARDDAVTLFGAFGTIERGHDDVMATLDWVASRFSDGTLVPEYRTVHVGEDTAFTVGFERGVLRVDGGEPSELAIRVTHVYRRVDDTWRIVHRHGDHPPALAARPRSDA